MGVSIDYMKAARLCVETCMGVKAGENVLVVTMPDSMEQAEAVAAAVFQQEAVPVIVSIPSKRLYQAKEPPRMVVEAMKSADVIMVVMHFLDSHLMYHTSARIEALKAGARLGNVWLTETNWDITADEIMATRELSIKVQKRLTAAKTARLTTPRGTDLRMDISGRESVMLCSILHNPGDSGVIPDYAEAAVAPVEGTSEGIFIPDCSMLAIGLLKNPMTWHIEKGRVVKLEGKEEADRLQRIIDGADENATNIAEFGIGTVIRGMVTGDEQDKRLLGTAHIGIGDSHSIGGKVRSKIHYDAVVLDATIELDGEYILKDGKLAF